MTSLRVIQEEWAGCTACGFDPPRVPLLGHGSSKAEILVIEEAPTYEDADSGEVIAGSRAHFLSTLLKNSGLNGRHIFKLTIVACRTYTTTEATAEASSEERDIAPKSEYIKKCYQRVIDTIYAVDPKVILLFGDKTWKTLVSDRGRFNTANQAHGSLCEVVIPGLSGVPLHYPAVVLASIKDISANPSSASFAPGPAAIQALTDLSSYLNTLETA